MPGETGGDPGRTVRASPACLRVYNEVVGFALSHPALGRLHQLTVDAYGAQHSCPDERDPRPIRLAYSLIGLYLGLECGRTGDEVRAAHAALGKPDRGWPAFPIPAAPWTTTVLDVAEAGLMADSVDGHAKAVRNWAHTVWTGWQTEHDAVADLTRTRLPHLF